MSEVYRANAALATNPKSAVLYGALANIYESDAQTKARQAAEDAAAGRSRSNFGNSVQTGVSLTTEENLERLFLPVKNSPGEVVIMGTVLDADKSKGTITLGKRRFYGILKTDSQTKFMNGNSEASFDDLEIGRPTLAFVQKNADGWRIKVFHLRPPAMMHEEARFTGVYPPPGGSTTRSEASATITIKADIDQAEVFVDGKFIGNSPAKLKLAVGAHVIEVRREGFDAYKKEVQVLEGSELNLNVQLRKQ